MTRFLTATALVLILTAVAGAQSADPDDNARLVDMLEGYQGLISIELDEDVPDIPGGNWSIAGQAIAAGYLRFTVDPVTDSLQRGARFHAVPGEDVTHIIVTTNLLNAWEKSPSTAYAILTRAVNEAAVFFRDPQAWGRARGDVMARLGIRSDNYGAEALFIRDRLLPAGFLLTNYETYVLDSFEQDGLVSVVLFLERFSLPVARALSEARQSFEDSNDAAGLRNAVLDLGEALLDARSDVSDDAEDREVYPLAVAVHSWLELTPDIIARIHNRDRESDPLPFDRILDIEREYAALRQRLETSRIADMPMMNYVHSRTVAGFEGF